MSNASIRADFGVLDQLSSDQGGHAGNIDALRATLKSHVSKAIDNFAGGMGQEQHQACMAKADQLIDEYISGVRQFQGSTNQVNDTFQAGGQKAQSILASGA
ncbi:hypothetical protein [Fodinicola feengrottensis]|uniref:WXG100 family type VII secretion target n=1 Tax=Fodinicola feengrottensis TaxID=435914 RepID=A0ABP4SW39_9ACTN|nr:hypothetical protein [Fodinicola feengrottensis]